MEELSRIKKVFEEKFRGNGIYNIDLVKDNDQDIVFIDVEGDWKHAHLYCDHLMEQLGYSCEYKKVTEEDGSDWYSATHGYVKA